MPSSISGRGEDSCDSSASPKGSPSCGINGHKQRRPPSITPRKLTRFFTPRSHGSFDSRKVLGNITAAANNCRETQSSPLRPLENVAAEDNYSHAFTRETKRRKLLHTPSPSPEHPGSSKSVFQYQFSSVVNEENIGEERNTHTLPCARNANGSDNIFWNKLSAIRGADQRIKRLDDRGLAGGLLQLSLDTSSALRRRHFTYPVTG
jgi:hypothetical protein